MIYVIHQPMTMKCNLQIVNLWTIKNEKKLVSRAAISWQSIIKELVICNAPCMSYTISIYKHFVSSKLHLLIH